MEIRSSDFHIFPYLYIVYLLQSEGRYATVSSTTFEGDEPIDIDLPRSRSQDKLDSPSSNTSNRTSRSFYDLRGFTIENGIVTTYTRVRCSVTATQHQQFGEGVFPRIISWTCGWNQVCCGTKCCSVTGSTEDMLSLLDIVLVLLTITVLLCCLGYCVCACASSDTGHEESPEHPSSLSPEGRDRDGKTFQYRQSNGCPPYSTPEYSAQDPNYYLPGYPPPYPPAYPQSYPRQQRISRATSLQTLPSETTQVHSSPRDSTY